MTKTELSGNQQGFASIVVALILILVLSLLTIGFAQLARREQQNALDKQLAVQANYAAESGINDAIQDINDGKIYGGTNGDASSTNCMTTTSTPTPLPAGADTANSQIQSADGVDYSCLLVDLQPPNLEYTNPSSSGIYQTFYNVNSNGTPTALDSLTINWSGTGYKALPTGVCSSLPVNPTSDEKCFPPSTQWESSGYPPVLEFSLTKLGSSTTPDHPNTVNVSRAALLGDTFTTYAYPSTSSTAVAFGTSAAAQGEINPAPCTATDNNYSCSFTVSGINGESGEWYLVRIVPIYDYGDLSMQMSPPTGIHFADGQVQIDVTGQAKNVLKRLRVAAPIVCSDATNPECKVTPPATLPDYAIEGNSVCKQFSIYPNDDGSGADTIPTPTNPSDPNYPDTCP